MNKQELIDKAVEDWLVVGAEVKVKSSGKIVKVERITNESGIACSDLSWYCRTEVVPHGNGWINGYRYGVEYPTNGKKPDLPDDTEIEWLSADSNWIKTKIRCLVWCVRDGGGQNISKFRIVDEHYKPVSETPEKANSVSNFKENNSNANSVTDNSWHERGERPPVGVECEVYFHKWLVCYFLGVTRKGNPIVEWGNGYAESLMADTKFRPIKSERDLFVEAVRPYMPNAEENVISQLYYAGFRAP